MSRTPSIDRAVAATAALALTLALALLAGCGGGSSSGGGDTPAPGSQSGGLSVGLAGGAPGPYRHAWVVVTSVALHTDPNRPWSPSDPSWQVLKLDTPKLVDLATSVNGIIASLITGKPLAAGSYGQMRLFLLRHDDALSNAAKDAQLLFNAQVEVVDAAGTTRELPLEFADGALGLRVDGPIAIAANVDNEFTVQWDLEHSLVRFASDDGVERVTMRPDLRWYDLTRTGAIIGLVDQTQFCTSGATAGCIDNVVASAELPSADGRSMVSVRSAPVVPGDQHAAFALYPLPAAASGVTFSVVIRGRNMRTMIVRSVPAGVADLLAANPTQLGVDMTDPDHAIPAPMVPLLSPAGDAQLSLAAPAVPPSAQLVFAQTPPWSGALPHEIAVANTDPFSGLLAHPAALPGGDLRIADYSPTGLITFGDAAPVEGSEHFSLTTRGRRVDDASQTVVVAAPSGSSTALSAPPATLAAGITLGTLTVDLSFGSPQSFDAAQLVVSDVGGIVATQDLSSLIGVAGAHTSVELPAGANAAALGATAVYSVAVRAWKRSSPGTSLQWARAPSSVDLRSAT
ncbi:MAG TPA: DUF4382 domain-containing protein, partial [Albitalea sp.]|nr:DUF4382 domain-containing protein [Albitalea sp.]